VEEDGGAGGEGTWSVLVWAVGGSLGSEGVETERARRRLAGVVGNRPGRIALLTTQFIERDDRAGTVQSGTGGVVGC